MSNDQHVPSRHKCLIYEGAPDAQLPVIVPLLKEGLRDHWRCLYLGSPEMVQMVDTSLQQHGINTAQEIQRQTLILSSDTSHMLNGKFDPKTMIDMLITTIDQAVKDGFVGLCATGDMRWELGADENFEQLLEYERMLEEVFHSKSLMGICQYHRDILPESAIKTALLTHKSAYVGDVLTQDNFFYLPPEMSKLKTNEQADWMSTQIVRVLKAERTRDIALHELSLLNLDLEKRVHERTMELESLNKHLESFSYSISHDLRAPLRSIHGFSAILSQEATELTPANKLHLQRIVRNADYMEKLIEGLLQVGRALNRSINLMPIDLSALSQELVEEYQLNYPDRKVQVQIQPGMQAQADTVLLHSVMDNLISNAWKFTGKSVSPMVEIGQSGFKKGKPIFFVKDNGVGFDSGSAKLFSPFRRFHKMEEYPGNGIGLATAERIITRHGGEMWAESTVGHGATFFFTLPAS